MRKIVRSRAAGGQILGYEWPMLDVVVVGAGSSGAAAAALLAERGMRVICVERRPLDRAGASWVNGVPRAAFAEAGIALPGADESDGRPAPFHVVASTGRAHVPAHDVIDVDMRKLVARLQARAVAAGADLRGEVSVHGRDGHRLATSAGALEARWIVDASGLTGARLLGQPRVARNDLCAAAQEVRVIRDLDAASAFFDHHRVRPGEVLGLVGVAGGYSVLNVRLRHDGLLGILTGSIPSLGFPSGKAILDAFVAQHAWVGARVFGGNGPISLRRAHDRLADDCVALLGDAGCQVFPAHGSGVGAGLVAARLLADTLAAGGTPRDYEVAWQRRHGGLFAFFDVFRRWNQSVDDATLSRVMHLGLLDAETLRAGIDQVLPRPSLRTLAAKARALAREPALAKALATTAARGVAVRALYARYPRQAAAVPAWARSVDWVLGV
jgi:flavin-dependent dehydrogenase